METSTPQAISGSSPAGLPLWVRIAAVPVTVVALLAGLWFFVLGALKGSRGNQQYEIPADVDTSRYTTAVIWCRAFTAFAAADLRAS